MKIKVGKIYKNNNGKIIKINRLESVDDYPFLGDDGFYYTKTGNFYLETNCDLDLIEEVITGENMNDHERKIADLENRIAELESRLTSCDGATAEPKKWSPVGGDWFITRAGLIREGATEKRARAFGIERPTQQQAGRAALEMRKFNRLLALRDELCGDELCGEGIAKYFIFFNTENKQWDFTHYFVSDYVTPCFTKYEHAQRACDMLNSGEVGLCELRFLKINGKVFECTCGVNLFHYDANSPTGCKWHICNGCGTTYESEVEL